MSIKIYDGYIVSTDGSLSAVHSLFMGFRKRVARLCLNGRARQLASDAVEIIDNHAADIIPSPGQPLAKTSNAMMEAMDDIKRGRRHPDYDFGCSVAFIPSKKKVLAILYSEREDYSKAWRRTAGVREYSYWDNSEELPAGVSKGQWRERRLEWGLALDGFRLTPAQAGFACECFGGYNMPSPTWADVMANLPSFESRVALTAHVTATSARSKAVGGKGMDGYLDARRWLKDDPDGIRASEAEKARIAKILKRELTLADVLGWESPRDEPGRNDMAII